MRLIDADALGNRMYHEAFEKDTDMQRWDSGCWIRYKLFENVLKETQTIDPVKHGKWIKNEDRYGWHCSVCVTDDVYAFEWNSDKGENELQDRYCPNCGAKMEMEGKDETD